MRRLGASWRGARLWEVHRCNGGGHAVVDRGGARNPSSLARTGACNGSACRRRETKWLTERRRKISQTSPDLQDETPGIPAVGSAEVSARRLQRLLRIPN